MSDRIEYSKNLLKGAQHFFSGTLVSRIFGLIRDVVMALFLGTSASLGAFFVAHRLAHLIRRILGEGALHSAFVPLFESKRAHNEKQATSFFISVSIALSTLLILFIVLSTSSIKMFLHFAQNNRHLDEVLSLVCVFLPSLFFICHTAFCNSYLNCYQSFFLPSFAPTLFNIFWILGILICPKEASLVHLAQFIVMGYGFQWALVFIPTFKHLKKERLGWPNLNQIAESSKQLFRPLSMGLLGASAIQINSALDSLFARWSTLEGPAQLWYAFRIQQLPFAIFGIALSTALLPSLSRLYPNQPKDFSKLLEDSLSRCIGLLIPCSIFLVFFGDKVLLLLFGYGKFGPESLISTERCLIAYGAGLFCQGVTLLFITAHNAQKNYKVPLRASLISLGLNTALNSLMVFYYGFSAHSVAWTTAISTLIQALYLGYSLYSKDLIKPASFLYRAFKGLSITLISAWVLIIILNQYSIGFESSFVQRGGFLFTTGISYLALIWILGTLFKSSEILEWVQFLPMSKNVKKRLILK